MRQLWLLCAAFALLVADSASAETILRFDPAVSFVDDAAPPVGYGDHVSSWSQAGFDYGGAADTPDVTVNFSNLVFELGAFTRFPSALRGELPGGVATIMLTADPGFLVTLHSFDLTTSEYSGGVTTGLERLSVTGGDSVFFRTFPFGPGGIFTVSPEVTGQSLTLILDDTFNGGGGELRLVGLDNLSFSQTVIVPEPSSMLLLAILSVFNGIARRSRQNQTNKVDAANWLLHRFEFLVLERQQLVAK